MEAGYRNLVIRIELIDGTMAWTQDQIRVLIDSYKDEPCLYAVKSPNYHNKHLRTCALDKVAAAVAKVRPGVLPKDCITKMHNLRNQFNVENKKRKSTINKSGSGIDDVYKPSLWYFDLLLFLEEHFVPRKSRCSSISSSIRGSAFVDDELNDLSQVRAISEGINSSGHLEVYTQFVGEDAEDSEDVPPLIPTLTTTSQTNTPLHGDESEEQLPPRISSPAPFSSSGRLSTPILSDTPVRAPVTVRGPVPKKRKRSVSSEDGEFVNVLQCIARTLQEPPTSTAVTPPPLANNSSM